MKCKNCKKQLKLKQRRWCSSKCRDEYRKELKKVICVKCGKIYYSFDNRGKYIKFKNTCRSCITTIINLKRNMSGKNNPNWKGGKKYSNDGRFGKDKNGLSWKIQRQLALKRDKYTCKICGKKRYKRNPDVHHKISYRISKSHSLKNLICLCKKCYGIEDNK